MRDSALNIPAGYFANYVLRPFEFPGYVPNSWVLTIVFSIKAGGTAFEIGLKSTRSNKLGAHFPRACGLLKEFRVKVPKFPCQLSARASARTPPART